MVPLVLLGLFLIVPTNSSYSLTMSVGKPSRGRLVEGLPFPDQFQGYRVRGQERRFTTPELIGALLDTIDGVVEDYPETCDLYMGDFSLAGGGYMRPHRSHQNGRDVDIGMYYKDNKRLERFRNMNTANLDVAKTWALVENLLATQRVQYIFMDRSLQRIFYRYAISQGRDPNYVDRLFKDAGTPYRGAIIRHARGHRNHLHVRFFTPWSTLAGKKAKLGKGERENIEVAQQAYLPKKVQYYVKGDEKDLDTLARNFGVTSKDLRRWNRVKGKDILRPGNCLVFYKRSFELEPMQVAQSLQPRLLLDPSPVKLAAIAPTTRVNDSSSPLGSIAVRKPKVRPPEFITYKVKKGDTLWSIARSNKMKLKTLLDVNGIKRNTLIRPGQKLKLPNPNAIPGDDTASPTRTAKAEKPAKSIEPDKSKDLNKPKATDKSAESTKSEEQKTAKVEKAPTRNELTTYVIKRGDTLWDIARTHKVKLDTLIEVNHIKNKRYLKPGQKLLVPVATAVARTETPKAESRKPESTKTQQSIKAENEKTEITKPQPATRPEPAPPGCVASAKAEYEPCKVAVPAARTQYNFHTIREGDTLWNIAQTNKIKLETLLELNDLGKDALLKIGRKLKVPTQATPAPDQPSSVSDKDSRPKAEKAGRTPAKTDSAANKTAAKKTPVRDKGHIIKEGDTLWVLARKYGTSVTTLCKLNEISPRSTLHLGMRLKVPANKRK